MKNFIEELIYNARAALLFGWPKSNAKKEIFCSSKTLYVIV